MRFWADPPMSAHSSSSSWATRLTAQQSPSSARSRLRKSQRYPALAPNNSIRNLPGFFATNPASQASSSARYRAGRLVSRPLRVGWMPFPSRSWWADNLGVNPQAIGYTRSERLPAHLSATPGTQALVADSRLPVSFPATRSTLASTPRPPQPSPRPPAEPRFRRGPGCWAPLPHRAQHGTPSNRRLQTPLPQKPPLQRVSPQDLLLTRMRPP